MTSLFVLILLSLLMGLAAFLFFLFSGKSKQFEDIEGPKFRMLNDDDNDDFDDSHKRNTK